jgi:hypothetical protein
MTKLIVLLVRVMVPLAAPNVEAEVEQFFKTGSV